MTKPNSLKIISGSKHVSSVPTVELPLLNEVPNPPEWLKLPEAIELFKYWAPIMVASGTLTVGGVPGLAVMCNLGGTLADESKRGVKSSAADVGQFRYYQNDFGLTPVAQGRLKIPEKQKGDGNKFGKFTKTA